MRAFLLCCHRLRLSACHKPLDARDQRRVLLSTLPSLLSETRSAVSATKMLRIRKRLLAICDFFSFMQPLLYESEPYLSMNGGTPNIRGAHHHNICTFFVHTVVIIEDVLL